MNVQSIKFILGNDSTNVPHGINLLYLQLNDFTFLPKNFTITNIANKKTYIFNDQMLKNTSSVISQFIDKNCNNSNSMQFQINIEDNNNVMEKVEHLYIGKKIVFSKNDLLILKEIIKQLNLNCFPSSINTITKEEKNINELKFTIDINSMLNFLQSTIFNSFTITTNKSQYICNIIGISTSNFLKKIVDNKQFKYNYDFNDTNYEFQIISDFFNFNTIKITLSNVKILKIISNNLQIKCLLKEIDSFINSYENSIEIISEKQPIVNNINELLDYLYNRKNVSVEETKDFIIQSFWCQTEENTQELVAYIIQVIHTYIHLHTFIMELLLLLDKSPVDNLNNKIISFLSQKLMQEIGYNKLNCAFIYRLCQKGFISKEEIAEEVNIQISLRDSNYENKNITSSGIFLNKYLKKSNDDESNDDRINNMLVWFFYELIEIKNISIDLILNKLDENHKAIVNQYYPKDIENFKKMRDNFEPNCVITKAIKDDDVENYEKYSNQKSSWFASPKVTKIPFNIFESYVQNGEMNFINYSAAYGSIKCFNFLSENYDVDENTLCYAIYGQNKEIYHIVKQKKNDSRSNLYIADDGNYKYWENELFPSVMTQQNDIFDVFFDDTDNKNDILFKELMKCILTNGNIHSFIKLIEKGFNLFDIANEEIENFIGIAAKNGFYQLTHLLFSILKTNKKFLIDFLQTFKIDDIFAFGNLSIVKLFISLDIKNADFENALAISIIRNYFNIIEYTFENYYKQRFQLSSDSALNLIKLSCIKKKPDLFKYLTNKFVGLENVIKEFPNPYDDSLLLYACENGNYEVVTFVYNLIEKQKLQIDCTNSFISAASKRYNEICQYLIEKKAIIRFSFLENSGKKITLLNIKTFTLLYDAVNQDEKENFLNKFLYDSIENHNIEIVEFLLTQNVSYSKALFCSVSCNDLEITKLILKHDSTPLFVNSISNDGTSLNIAVVSNNIEIVKILLAIKGIDPSLYAKSGNPPLVNAFLQYNVAIINLLYDFYGSDIQLQISQLNQSLREILRQLINYKGTKFFFIISCEEKIVESINKLLEIKNIDFNYHNEKLSLLIFACKFNQQNIVAQLVKNESVDVNLYESENGNTPLMISIENMNRKIAELLIQSPRISINKRNFKMNTALTFAVDKNLTEIVDLIIKHQNFDPNESCLDFSFFISENEVTKQLISVKGLDVNYLNENDEYEHETSLVRAVKSKNNEKVKLIIQHQSFNPMKSQIKTAIFASASNNSINIFRELLPLINNDVNICSKDNESLLVEASKNNSQDIINEIINNNNFDSIKSQLNIAFDQLLSNGSDYILVKALNDLYKYDEKHCYLINFKKLLSSGKSFFTSIPANAKNASEIAAFLLSHGADPNLPDGFDICPLQHAINICSEKLVKELISSDKIDIFRRINIIDKDHHKIKSTYLHLAAQCPNMAIFKQIFDLNLIDINSVDSNGDTPLIIATKNEKYGYIKYLFEKDELNYMHCNNNGYDALTIIIEMKKSTNNFEIALSKEMYLNQLLSFNRWGRSWGSAWGSPLRSRWGAPNPTGWGTAPKIGWGK